MRKESLWYAYSEYILQILQYLSITVICLYLEGSAEPISGISMWFDKQPWQDLLDVLPIIKSHPKQKPKKKQYPVFLWSYIDFTLRLQIQHEFYNFSTFTKPSKNHAFSDASHNDCAHKLNNRLPPWEGGHLVKFQSVTKKDLEQFHVLWTVQ